MLVDDLERLPDRDRTEIGTKGTALSGDQQQRVSLARGLYRNAEILIIDDVFSGLDNYTQEQVARAVFGPDGLLRRRGTTALVCIHSTDMIPMADRAILLSENGIIIDQGMVADIRSDETRAGRFGLKRKTEIMQANDNRSQDVLAPKTNTPTPLALSYPLSGNRDDALPSTVIDDIPLNNIDPTALRERLMTALQHAVILPEGSLFRASLDPWGASSDDERTAVLRDLGLAVLVENKGGLDGKANRAELSAGQRQLFILARIILRRLVKLR
ncbi:hypothetical protein E0Z10_g6188 [Xylaria hypoxylon]|uniref:ABC transporter domain-containing protein n=1 Tax=Xylaria hypoxylon TaxID=37992 RepID=A0A4Z0YEX2_9PEZI|nr:hypothetical protein E0Z10_g6188 [Xylaria hypoxylon]